MCVKRAQTEPDRIFIPCTTAQDSVWSQPFPHAPHPPFLSQTELQAITHLSGHR